MKKMLVLSALLAALLFFACGEKQDSSAPEKKADAAVVEPAVQEDAPATENEAVADENSEE